MAHSTSQTNQNLIVAHSAAPTAAAGSGVGLRSSAALRLKGTLRGSRILFGMPELEVGVGQNVTTCNARYDFATIFRATAKTTISVSACRTATYSITQDSAHMLLLPERVGPLGGKHVNR